MVTGREVVVAQPVDKSDGADLRATEMLIGMPKTSKRKPTKRRPRPPEPCGRREVTANLIARPRKSREQEFQERDTGSAEHQHIRGHAVTPFEKSATSWQFCRRPPHSPSSLPRRGSAQGPESDAAAEIGGDRQHEGEPIAAEEVKDPSRCP